MSGAARRTTSETVLLVGMRRKRPPEPEVHFAQAESATVVTNPTAWLDLPALQPGGALAAERRGALGPFDVVQGRLVAGSSGVHHFVLAGSPGVTLLAKLASDAFEPVVAVIGPSGIRWDLSSRARIPQAGAAAGAWASQDDLVLPDAGDYVLVVTSRENVNAARAVTTADYRLTLRCDAPRKEAEAGLPGPTPSSRGARFGAWESEPR